MANATGEKKTITIDIEKFVHTRNALNTAFLGLSNSIDKAVKAYIEHTQAVLEDDGTLDLSLLLQPFETLAGASSTVQRSRAQNDILASAVASVAAAGGPLDATVDGVEKKKKRAYKPRDPNAPKRPLTAYFRYIRDLRPIIKQEMADGVRPTADVSNTCSEMWHALTPEEREAYKKDYQKEVIGYEVACAAYKAAGGTDEGMRIDYTDGEDLPAEEEEPFGEPYPGSEPGTESEQEAPPPPPAKKTAAAKAKSAPAPQAVKAASTPAAKPKAAPRKKVGAAAAAANTTTAAAAPATAAPTPKTETKQKFSSLNPPNTSIDEAPATGKAEAEKTPTARKRKATAKAAADETIAEETPKPKRVRKTKAMKEAEEAELAKTLEEAATATPAAAAPASESKAKKPRKRKSEAAAAE